MKHRGTQNIETDRLLLRRFVIDDADAMYRNWASDPEVTKYLTWPAHDSIDVTRTVLEDWVSSYSREDYYQWAIVLKEHGNDPIGGSGIGAPCGVPIETIRAYVMRVVMLCLNQIEKNDSVSAAMLKEV